MLLHKDEVLGIHLEAPAPEIPAGWGSYPIWEKNRNWTGGRPEAAWAAILLSIHRRIIQDEDSIIADGLREDLDDPSHADDLWEAGGYWGTNLESAEIAERGWARLHNELTQGGGDALPPTPTLHWAADILWRLPGAVREPSGEYPQLELADAPTDIRDWIQEALKKLKEDAKSEAKPIPEWEVEILRGAGNKD